jgi:hypothetical protein
MVICFFGRNHFKIGIIRDDSTYLRTIKRGLSIEYPFKGSEEKYKSHSHIYFLMRERKKFPTGIVLCIIFIIVLDAVYAYSLAYYLMFVDGYLSMFLSFSTLSIVMWIDVLLTTLSLVIIPYGFLKRKQGARTYAFVFLAWSALGALLYIALTGDKLTRFPLFVLYVVFMTYLLTSPAKRYFGTTPTAVAPTEPTKEYTYGDYTLYSELVQLKNNKMQLIYFFSKRKPKSGTPARFPSGFEVQTSKRSGLPYLKRNEASPPMGIT